MSATTAGEPRRRAEVLPERRPTAPKRRGAASAPGRRALTAVPAQRAAPGRRAATPASRPRATPATPAAPVGQAAEPQVSGQLAQQPPVALPAGRRDQVAAGYTKRGQAGRPALIAAVPSPLPGSSNGEPSAAPARASRAGDRLRAVTMAPQGRAGDRSRAVAMASDGQAGDRSRATNGVPEAAAGEWPRPGALAPRTGAGQRVRRAPNAAATRPARSRPRVRLTRRGRIVVSALVLAAMLGVVALAWLAGTARAEASGSGVPASAVYKSVRSVIVLPGQSLWTIAAQAEPSADPRSVIQQIIDLNALGGTSIHPGQRLLIPRG